jgi:hypothetical protein
MHIASKYPGTHGASGLIVKWSLDQIGRQQNSSVYEQIPAALERFPAKARPRA